MKTVVTAIKTTTSTTANNNSLNSTADANTAGNISIIPKSEEDNTGDLALQFQTPNAVINSNTNTNTNANKRPLSLDLNKTTKKARLTTTTPFLMETLNTPELEKIILSNNLLQTPKPGIVYPSKVGEVTTEQEEYVKGFEEALIKIHNSKSAQTNPTTNVVSSTVPTPAATVTTAGAGMSGGSFTYTNLDSFSVVVKDEPQNPPVSPTVQPIDMENQELIKLERKRLRNRVAASKCRKRKLERISKLEDKVKVLKTENTELGSILKSLKDHVAQLKQEVIQHLDSGCTIPTIGNGFTLLSAK